MRRFLLLGLALSALAASPGASNGATARWSIARRVLLESTGLAWCGRALPDGTIAVTDRRKAAVSLYGRDGKLLRRYDNHDVESGGLTLPFFVLDSPSARSFFVFDIGAGLLHTFSFDLKHLAASTRPDLTVAFDSALAGGRLWIAGPLIRRRSDGKRFAAAGYGTAGGTISAAPSSYLLDLSGVDEAFSDVVPALSTNQLSLTSDGLLWICPGLAYRAQLVTPDGDVRLDLTSAPVYYHPPSTRHPPNAPGQEKAWRDWYRTWNAPVGAIALGNDLGILVSHLEGDNHRLWIDRYDRQGRVLRLREELPGRPADATVLESAADTLLVLEVEGAIEAASNKTWLTSYEFH